MKHVAKSLFCIEVALALPFVLLLGASLTRIATEGFRTQYLNSALLGLFCAAFSVAVGYMLRQKLLERID